MGCAGSSSARAHRARRSRRPDRPLRRRRSPPRPGSASTARAGAPPPRRRRSPLHGRLLGPWSSRGESPTVSGSASTRSASSAPPAPGSSSAGRLARVGVGVAGDQILRRRRAGLRAGAQHLFADLAAARRGSAARASSRAANCSRIQLDSCLAVNTGSRAIRNACSAVVHLAAPLVAIVDVLRERLRMMRSSSGGMLGLICARRRDVDVAHLLERREVGLAHGTGARRSGTRRGSCRARRRRCGDRAAGRAPARATCTRTCP